MLLRGEVQDLPQSVQSLAVSTEKEIMLIKEKNIIRKNVISNEDIEGKVDFEEDDIFDFVNIDSAEKNRRKTNTAIIDEFNNEIKTKENEQEYGTFACDNLHSAPSFYQSAQRMEIVQIESKASTEDNSICSPYVMGGSHQKFVNARDVQQEKVRTWLDREKERTARGSHMYGLDNISIGDILEKRNRDFIPEQFLSTLKHNTNDASRYTDSGTFTGAGASPYPMYPNPCIYPYPSSSSLSSSFFALPPPSAVVMSTTSAASMAAAPLQQPEQWQDRETQLTETRHDSKGLTSPQRNQNTIPTSATSPISYFPSSLDMSAMGASTSGRIVGYNSHIYTHGVSWSEQQYALSDRAIMAALARKQADIEKYERANKDYCNISYSDISTQRGGFTMNTSRYDHPHSYHPCQPAELVFDLRESMVNLPKNQNVSIRQNTPILESTAAPSSSLAVKYGHQNLDRRSIPKSLVLSSSLYFRSQIANFGRTAVGCNSRLKLELCNSSTDEVRTSVKIRTTPSQEYMFITICYFIFPSTSSFCS